MRRLLIVLTLALSACAAGPSGQQALCGPSGRLRVGLVGSAEGRRGSAGVILAEQEQFKLRELLMASSRCDVLLEPVLSPEQARLRLRNSEWDLAFLPPGLTAVALEQEGQFSLVRQLGRRQNSKSQLVVRADSRFKTRADLRGTRLGLLPRGSLTGFYLPLFNLHGLTFSQVGYELTYQDLMQGLKNREFDVIAWDGALPTQGDDIRIIHEDTHAIPLGALALSQPLLAQDYKPFVQKLDDNVSQLPSSLGYATGVIPDLLMLQELRAIVSKVEGWSLPQAGQPYVVYGTPSRSMPGEGPQ